jgi:hypothetical protein
MPIRATTRDQLRQDFVAALKAMPAVITDASALFVTLTGLSQARLRKDWKAGVKTTSCNSFAGWCGREAGALNGGTLATGKLDLSRCDNEVPGSWVWANTGEAIDANLMPRPGDFYSRPFPGQTWGHVGIVTDVDLVGMRWELMQGGQGGPKSGYDKIERKWFKFDRAAINGWVDLGAYVLPEMAEA